MPSEADRARLVRVGFGQPTEEEAAHVLLPVFGGLAAAQATYTPHRAWPLPWHIGCGGEFGGPTIEPAPPTSACCATWTSRRVCLSVAIGSKADHAETPPSTVTSAPVT